MTTPAAPTPSPAAQTKKILVARFSSSLGAKAGLEQLKNAGSRLGNAAVIEREADGKISFTETQDWGVGKSALVGALAAIVIPGIGPIMGAIAGGLAAYLIDAGFPDDLLRQMGAGLEIGTSMLVVLVEGTDLAHAEQVVVQAGGTVLGSGFDADLGAVLAKMREGGAAPG
ncbi:MAG: DUF1269 domain-containing protein [Gemmatimonadaceae bacterium]